MKLRWLGHSAWILTADDGTKIVFDPFEAGCYDGGIAYPPINETADIVLSYNGEVYNHLELRGQLEGLGYRFRSDCDSETVLYSFQEWGIECLDRFKGQFAFAVWDGPSQTVYLARDRVGLQPLYFYSHDGLVI